ncbi:MAG: hypothetical protein P8075_19485 [Deltaproteobacteria bacterium]|jgi:hypothetical protein
MSSEERKTMYSDRLLKLTRTCPECGTLMNATGKMYYDKTISEWLIEYWCSTDEENFAIYTPETKELVEHIVKSVIINNNS